MWNMHTTSLDLWESTNHLNENGETSDGWDASDYLSMVNNSSLVQMIWDRVASEKSFPSHLKYGEISVKFFQRTCSRQGYASRHHQIVSRLSPSGRAASSNWRRVWAEWGPGCVSECDVLLSHHEDMVPSGKLT